MAGCSCCDQPPCAGAFLQWESRSASKGKVGWAEYGTPSSPPRRYLTLTKAGSASDSVTTEGSSTCSNEESESTADMSFTQDEVHNANPATGAIVVSGSMSENESITTHAVAECAEFYPTAGQPKWTQNIIINGSWTVSNNVRTGNKTEQVDLTCNCPAPCPGSNRCPGDFEDYPYDDPGTPTEIQNYAGAHGSNFSSHLAFADHRLCGTCSTEVISQTQYKKTCTGGNCEASYTNTLSNEYTTALLIANAVAALPAYDGSWNDTAGSFRSLSSDELSYTVRESKYRLRHNQTGTGFLRVWLRRKFTPSGGGDPTYTALDPYTWNRSGAYDPTATITSEEFTVPVPDSNGTETVEIVKYSCVSGYEPGEGQPNGYPLAE